MRNETIFITQIGTVIAYVGSLFVLYRLLVSQKDSVIELLKERLASEISKVEDLKMQTPDALVDALNGRVQIMNGELDRLRHDGNTTAEVIAGKEQELSAVRAQLLKLSELIEDSDLVCPDCSAPLIQRRTKTVYGYIGDKEVDADIEYSQYECGATFEDSTRLTPCNKSRAV